MCQATHNRALGRLVAVFLAVACAGCHDAPRSPLGSGTERTERTTQESVEESIAGLQNLSVAENALGSSGGPHVGIGGNSVTKKVIDHGDRAVPLLIKGLDTSGWDESVFIVFCLRELRAKVAKDRVARLEKEIRDEARFASMRRDATLEVQIKFFLRDVDTWK